MPIINYLRVTDVSILLRMFFIFFLPRELDGFSKNPSFFWKHQGQPLALPSAIHLRTATMPALTVTLSANALGSALGASGVVGPP